MNAHQRRIVRRALLRVRAARLSPYEVVRLAAQQFATTIRLPFDMVTGERAARGKQ